MGTNREELEDIAYQVADHIIRHELNIVQMEEIYSRTLTNLYDIGREIAERRYFLNEQTTSEIGAFPPCGFKEHCLGGKVIYQLSFEGMMPLYNKDHKLQQKMRDYYYDAVKLAVKDKDIEPLAHAFLYICHFFKDLIIRDLDNRNRRHLINALRVGRIISGDDWKKITVMESGFMDMLNQTHHELFITEDADGLDMVKYVKDLHQKGIDIRVI